MFQNCAGRYPAEQRHQHFSRQAIKQHDSSLAPSSVVRRSGGRWPRSHLFPGQEQPSVAQPWPPQSLVALYRDREAATRVPESVAALDPSPCAWGRAYASHSHGGSPQRRPHIPPQKKSFPTTKEMEAGRWQSHMRTGTGKARASFSLSIERPRRASLATGEWASGERFV